MRCPTQVDFGAACCASPCLLMLNQPIFPPAAAPNTYILYSYALRPLHTVHRIPGYRRPSTFRSLSRETA